MDRTWPSMKIVNPAYSSGGKGGGNMRTTVFKSGHREQHIPVVVVTVEVTCVLLFSNHVTGDVSKRGAEQLYSSCA